jgi:small redox-active disulfide protein 2
MEIKVLGTGCAKCKALENAVREAVTTTGIEAQIMKVEDITEIMKLTMTTPALVINGKVVVKGRVPAQNELIQILKQ